MPASSKRSAALVPRERIGVANIELPSASRGRLPGIGLVFQVRVVELRKTAIRSPSGKGTTVTLLFLSEA